jgi:hypothetical protein
MGIRKKDLNPYQGKKRLTRKEEFANDHRISLNIHNPAIVKGSGIMFIIVSKNAVSGGRQKAGSSRKWQNCLN